MLCTSCNGLLENLGSKNSVDTELDLCKDVKFLCIIRGFWHKEDLVGEGRGALFKEITYLFKDDSPLLAGEDSQVTSSINRPSDRTR